MSPPSPPVTVDRLGFFSKKIPCAGVFFNENHAVFMRIELNRGNCDLFFQQKNILKKYCRCFIVLNWCWCTMGVFGQKNGCSQSYGWFTVHFGESSVFFLRDVVFMLVACCSYKWSYETLLNLGFWSHLAGTKQKLSTNVSCVAFDDHRASHPTLRPCLTFTKILWNS